MCFEAPAPVLHLRLHLTLVFVEWCERRALYVLFKLSRSVFGDASTTMFAFVFILSWLCLVCRHVYTVHVHFNFYSVCYHSNHSNVRPTIQPSIRPCRHSIWPSQLYIVSFEKSSAVPLPKRCRYNTVCSIDLCCDCVCVLCMLAIDVLNLDSTCSIV